MIVIDLTCTAGYIIGRSHGDELVTTDDQFSDDQFSLDCPECWKPLAYVHSVPAFGEYPQLDLYRCQECGHALTVKQYQHKADEAAA